MLKACFRLSRTFWRLDGVRNLWIFIVACALQAAESPFTKAQIPCHSEPCESKAKNPLAKLRFAINTLTFKANTLNVNVKPLLNLRQNQKPNQRF